MPTAQSIERAIADHLPCEHVAVRGDGHHWEALVVSARFEGLPKVRQHQLVYAALGDLMRTDIHALAIDARAPNEA